MESKNNTKLRTVYTLSVRKIVREDHMYNLSFKFGGVS